MINTSIKKQLSFLIEIDKVKNIIRKTKLFDGSRLENDAEHSWTICIMAVLLKEYANFDINIERVLIMLLVHDIVEIDAGDTFLYSSARNAAHDKEVIAANRIFGLLDTEQADYFLSIWKEFEARQTNESKFASVFDRLEPVLQNYLNEGFAWKTHGITKSQVIEKNKHIAEGSVELWKFVEWLLDDAEKRGFFSIQSDVKN
jgi:putative hydrolase of HD superfamily